MEFHANIYARKQLELGNQAYGLNNVQDAERFWNHAMKSACTVTCYDHGKLLLFLYLLLPFY